MEQNRYCGDGILIIWAFSYLEFEIKKMLKDMSKVCDVIKLCRKCVSWMYLLYVHLLYLFPQTCVLVSQCSGFLEKGHA